MPERTAKKVTPAAQKAVLRRLPPPGEKLKPAPCPRCGCLTGLGLDSNVCALVVRVDLAALDPTATAWAVARRQPVFELRGSATYRYLQYVHPMRALRRGFVFANPVLAEHRCTEGA